MKLLVAGSAGYLGSVLILRLLDRGHEFDVVRLLCFGNHLPNQVGVLNKDISHPSVFASSCQVASQLSNDAVSHFCFGVSNKAPGNHSTSEVKES